jgi:hypothetical protein
MQSLPTSGLRLAATAVVVALLLGACGVTDSTRGEAPDTQDEPTTSAAPEPDTEPIALEDVAEGTSLDPGVYLLPARSRPDLPAALLEVPSGFVGGGEFIMATGKGFAALAYWEVTHVYANACSKQGLRDAGSSVEDLAEALESQAMLLPTGPVAVAVNGHEGLYLEMSAPDLDYQSCKMNDVAFWHSAAGDLYSGVAGSVVRVWILDVDGRRAVLNTYAEPGATKAQVERLTKLVESARFIGADGSEL